MPIIVVPYHLDEYLPELDIPLPSDVPTTTVVETLPMSTVWTRLAFLQGSVADAVEQSAGADGLPIVLSGDCVTSLGIMAGIQHAGIDAGIVWFDAHGDVQTLETTASGYIGGMPLRMLVGYRPDLLTSRIKLQPIAEHRAALVDARDLDPPEASYLEASNIVRSSVDDLTAAVLPGGPLVLHLDLDVVDCDEIEGLRYPVPGGPTANAVLDAAGRVLDTGQVAAVSVGCTWYPGQEDPTGARARFLYLLWTLCAERA